MGFDKTVTGNRHPCCTHHILFFYVTAMTVWFWQQPGFIGYSKSLTLYKKRNVHVSVYKSWLKAIHQHTHFLETTLLPLLHRSAWPVDLLLNPIRGAQKLDDDIFQGWAPPVRDASYLWHSRQTWWVLRATSIVQFTTCICVMSSASHETAVRIQSKNCRCSVRCGSWMGSLYSQSPEEGLSYVQNIWKLGQEKY